MDIPARIQQQIDAAKELEAAALQLAEDLKYPVSAKGHVLDMNHLPDVPEVLVYHLIRCGWRPDPEKRVIKQRRVIGGGYYEDLVTYVGVDEPDTPVVVERNPQPIPEEWSVKPVVNVIEEPRPND